jgi:hypothetical protein
MSIVAELAARPGVIAAGEYSYRGDRFQCKGELSEEHARMASIMCRATNLSAHMQTHFLALGMDPCPSTRPRAGACEDLTSPSASWPMCSVFWTTPPPR